MSQHGTGREYVKDALENALAVLQGGKKRNDWPVEDVIVELARALSALTDAETDIDEPGLYGKDHKA